MLVLPHKNAGVSTLPQHPCAKSNYASGWAGLPRQAALAQSQVSGRRARLEGTSPGPLKGLRAFSSDVVCEEEDGQMAGVAGDSLQVQVASYILFPASGLNEIGTCVSL